MAAYKSELWYKIMALYDVSSSHFDLSSDADISIDAIEPPRPERAGEYSRQSGKLVTSC